MVHGYETELISDPKIVSRGEWTLTGTQECQAFTPLKRTSTLSSGLWGTSGVYYVRNQAQVYDDISGISGCIGVSLHKMLKDSDTGMTNINRPMFRRQMSVLHYGMIKLPYVSGTLDGSVVTLTWGDRIAPCISGFRAWQEINYHSVEENTGDMANALHTGVRQQVLGIYMDTPCAVTGETGQARRKVLINPEAIYGVHK